MVYQITGSTSSPNIEIIVPKVDINNPKYAPSFIRDALIVAKDCHKDQLRYSGESFIEHPTRVAENLNELRNISPYSRYVDYKTYMAALLHDAYEDDGLSLTLIETMFGKDVSSMVHLVTRYGSRKNSNKRIANSDNIPAILLRLTDKVDNSNDLKKSYLPEHVRFSEMEDIFRFYLEISAKISPYHFRKLAKNVAGLGNYRGLFQRKSLPDSLLI